MTRQLAATTSLTALAALAATFLGAPADAASDHPTSVAAECTIQELPLPAGYPEGIVTGGDPTGRYLVGWVRNPMFAEYPAVWHKGTAEALDFGFSQGQTLTDAHRDGTLVGTFVPSGPSRGFIVTPDGTFQELGLGGELGSIAAAIDADGTVVGGLNVDGYVPSLWRPGSYDEPEVLESTGPDTRLLGVAKGRAVGIDYAADPWRTYVWSGPSMRQRPLSGIDPAAFVEIVDATGKWAAGSEENLDTGSSTMLRWNLKRRAVDQVEVPPMVVNSINSKGVIGGIGNGAAVLAIGDDAHVLPPLETGKPAGVHLVTNAGDAAGYAINQADDLKPVRWRCG